MAPIRFRQPSLFRNKPTAWRIVFKRGNGKDFDWCFEATECGVVKFLQMHGAADLVPYCNFFDVAQSQVIGLGMRQPAHIGSGNKVCIECVKRGRETEIPPLLQQALEA